MTKLSTCFSFAHFFCASALFAIAPADAHADTISADKVVLASRVEQYGSTMGDVSSDVVSQRTYMYYDQYNNPLRETVFGLTSDDEWLLTYYTKYDYDDNHHLTAKYSDHVMQYTDGSGDYYYASNNDTVTYEYNDAGLLSREYTVASGRYTVYEYDDEGQLVYTATISPDRLHTHGGEDYVVSSEAYSDFVGFDMPTLAIGDSYYESSRYVKDIEYDEDGHKVKATTWIDSTRTTMSAVEHWTWRNDSLVEYLNNSVSGGEEVYNKRTLYECVDGDPHRVRTTSWYYSSGYGWRSEGLPKVTYYGVYSAASAPTALEVSHIENDVNSGELSFVPPTIDGAGELSFNIYRDGILVGSVDMADSTAFDSATGRVSYADRNVPNGEGYEYMVQTVVKDSTTGDSAALNVSGTVTTSYYVDLPAVTNLRYVSYSSLWGTDLVTVAWDAPENLDPALLFERYNVFVGTSSSEAANSDEDGQATECTVTFTSSVEDIYVQSIYHYGRVYSDTLTIDLNNLPSTDGINAATAESGVVSVSPDRISVDGGASSIAIYGVGGAVELRLAGTDGADISGLRPGVYVAVVCVGDKCYAVKFAK